MNPEFSIRKSQFTKFLEQKNPFFSSGFDEWIFYPGMLFHDFQKWWGSSGNRNTPHEGIDLCFYRDKTGQIRSLTEKTKIPVMFDGRIILIHDDFLGKSIYVRHNNICDDSGNLLHTIYGHTIPLTNCITGKFVNGGDAIATIAHTKKNLSIFPHVHITAVLFPETFPYEKLNWETVSNDNSFTLMNPLELIDCKYRLTMSIDSANR